MSERSEAAAAAAFVIPGYELGERIGAGGFGEVYRAKHALMGRQVAIKVLNAKYSSHPEAVARFVSEARAVARISHPGIVDVFDFGQLSDGRQYCVMELVRGTTLRDVLKDRTRLPLAEALPILRAIAEAIDAAHDAGIAHRDLKPDNVFVTDDGVKLIDFGLAKLTADDATAVTETGTIFGTPLYMSPEQCRGKSTDTRTDAYSFGALAYHVLVGAPPFTGEALEIALHHLNDAPAPPSVRCAELDEKVDRVVLALMAKDPAQRPPLLAPAIAAIAGEAALPALYDRPRRARWPFVALGVVAAGGIAAFALSRAKSSTGADAASCAPATERLAGVWDAPTREALAATFRAPKQPAVDATWRAVLADLDDYAGKWSTQWETACTADRSADPLLAAQRDTCLENALIDLRGITRSLATSDPVAFSEGWNGVFMHASLADCANEKALRAQTPAPPPENRDKVADAMTKVREARLAMRAITNAGRPGNPDAIYKRLDQLATDLEGLRSTSANVAWWFRGSYYQINTSGNAVVRSFARNAVDKAIQKADASRDDGWLATNFDTLARIEYDSGNLDAADQALARADSALARAGGASTPAGWIAVTHARLDAARGRLDQALARLDGIRIGDWTGAGTEISDRVHLLLRAGRGAEAVALQKRVLADQRARFGDQHWMTALQHAALADALAWTGDAKSALAELAAALDIYTALRASPSKVRPLLVSRLVLAVQSGDDALAERTAALIVHPAKPDEPLTQAELLQIGQLALDRFALPTARWAIDRITVAEGPLAPIIAELRSAVAAIRGDVDGIERYARESSPTARSTGNEVRIGSWILGFVEIARGKRSAAEARLARLASVSANADPQIGARARMYSAWLLLALGRSRDAVRELEIARRADGYNRDHTLAAIDAWLGSARVEAGDLRAAITPLEEALDILSECCAVTSWITPGVELSLAMALWDTGGDRVRARRLAGDALAHYQQLGARHAIVLPALTAENAAAWLAAHTEARAGEPVTTGCPAPASPKAPGTHKLYVVTEGITLARGQVADARQNQTTLFSAERVTFPPFLPGVADRAARIAAIVEILQATLAPYSIDVVTTRPASGDYRMAVMGGSAALIGVPNALLSTAPFDCTPNAENNISLLFDFGTTPTAEAYARTVLGDLGSMLGLGAVLDPRDCMCRNGPECETKPARCTFGAQVSLPLAFAMCGRTQQDEAAMMKDALGCR